MKTIYLVLLSIALSYGSKAQERWMVQLNSKTLLTANKEDTVANVATITDIKKGSLVVTYVPGKAQSGWGRRLMVFDAANNELYSKEDFSMIIPAANLKKWHRSGIAQLKVYTIAVPKDPRIKVKLRRVHLCTINLED